MFRSHRSSRRQQICGQQAGTPVAQQKMQEVQRATRKVTYHNNYFCHFPGCGETANSW